MSLIRPQVETFGRRPPDGFEALAVRECNHPDCEARPQDRFDFPLALCRQHLVNVLTRSAELIRVMAGPTNRLKEENKPPIVYYLQFGDRIKIGTTINLRRRLGEIPHDRVLATEPGGHSVETKRHKQFGAERITGEWFEPSERLLTHIRELRAARGSRNVA